VKQKTPNKRQTTIDVPVRILVPSESVGAIIGKGGQTIRQLTQQTRAKVDVYRGDPMAPTTALQEKVITIRGQPENCINACREILKVMKADAESKGKPSDTPLKVLAHNDYIGRIIGKQGNIINTIKKETETTVTVSSINDMSMNVERVITVKGELENMIRALEIIHSKVKSAFENDTKTYGAQAIMMGGIPPIPLAPPSFAAASSAAAAAAAAHHPNASAPPQQVQQASAQQGPGSSTSQSSGQSQPTNNQANTNAGNSNVSAGGSASGAGAPVPPPPPPPTNAYSNYYQPIYHHPAHHMAPQLQPYGAQNPLLPPQSQQPPPPAPLHPGQHGHGMGAPNMGNEYMSQVPEPETVYLYIPNVAVGAIIGTKGSFIKNIIKLSGASVKITPLTPEESKTVLERQVVIVGTPDSQWKAQYYIYEKIRQERFATDENVKLRAEIQVPSHIVGRIIGKAGKNVRELQRTTGATIKLPEDIALNQQQQNDPNAQQTQQDDENDDENNTNNTSVNNSNQLSPTTTTAPSLPIETTPNAAQNNQQTENGTTESNTSTNNDQETKQDVQPASPNAASSSNTNTNSTNNSFVIVRIFGTFQASQLAQRRIQSLVMQSLRGYSNVDPILMNQRTLTNITNHHAFQMPPFLNTYPHHPGAGVPPPPPHHHQQQPPHHHHHQQQHPRGEYMPRLNGAANPYNNSNNISNRRNNRHQQNNKLDHNKLENSNTNGSSTNNTPTTNTNSTQQVTTNGNSSEQINQQPQPQTA